jgi:site-specific recombinase XerD
MKITAIIRKDQVDKNGLCKVYIRINNGSKRNFIPSGIKVKPNQFVKGWVKNHKEAIALNQKLALKISEVEKAPLTRYDKFEDFARKFITQSQMSAETIRYYNIELKRFSGYAPGIPINVITTDLLRDYRASLTLHSNSKWKALKFIRTILNAAIEQEIIFKNPVKPLKIKYVQGDREFLTQDEVNKIVKVASEEGPARKCAQWFLFQCYTGIAFADLQRIDVAKILAEGRIVMQRKKTKNQLSIPLLPEAKQILIDAPSLNLSNQQYNTGLKIVAVAAGIKKILHSHIARHSFGIRLAELKISKEVAMKLLGHSRPSTTDIYYKIFDKRVEEEFKDFSYD